MGKAELLLDPAPVGLWGRALAPAPSFLPTPIPFLISHLSLSACWPQSLGPQLSLGPRQGGQSYLLTCCRSDEPPSALLGSPDHTQNCDVSLAQKGATTVIVQAQSLQQRSGCHEWPPGQIPTAGRCVSRCREQVLAGKTHTHTQTQNKTKNPEPSNASRDICWLCFHVSLAENCLSLESNALRSTLLAPNAKAACRTYSDLL
ncbi:hypothetical protein VULLAG_LOCUS10501 [Vulpes lagopus]